MQIFKWMPIKSENSSQENTPIQQLLETDNQQFDQSKESMENSHQRDGHKPNAITEGSTISSLNMQTGSATMNTGNGFYNANSHNGIAAQTNLQQGGDSLQNSSHAPTSNKHPLSSDNEESLFDTTADFPPFKRQRTMPESSFLGLGGDHKHSVPVLSSDVKVIDPNDSSLHNSSSTVFCQMNPSTTVLPTSTNQQSATEVPLLQTESSQTSTATSSSSSPYLTMNAEDHVRNDNTQSPPDDIEMMETDMTNEDLEFKSFNVQSSTLSNSMIDMDDLSDIARAVTEQIVTRVSACHGPEN